MAWLSAFTLKREIENEDFEDLLVDAKRVREGGQSSKSIAKAKKDAKNIKSKPSGGEEE